MKTDTKLGSAVLIYEGLEKHNGNTWRATFGVDYELSRLGVRCMNDAANEVGDISLALFDDKAQTLTLIIDAEYDPEKVMRLWWKKFRARIEPYEVSELIGNYSASVQEAMAVNSSAGSWMMKTGEE